MAQYRDKESGVIIETDSILSGSWELVEEKKTKAKKVVEDDEE